MPALGDAAQLFTRRARPGFARCPARRLGAYREAAYVGVNCSSEVEAGHECHILRAVHPLACQRVAQCKRAAAPELEQRRELHRVPTGQDHRVAHERVCDRAEQRIVGLVEARRGGIVHEQDIAAVLHIYTRNYSEYFSCDGDAEPTRP